MLSVMLNGVSVCVAVAPVRDRILIDGDEVMEDGEGFINVTAGQSDVLFACLFIAEPPVTSISLNRIDDGVTSLIGSGALAFMLPSLSVSDTGVVLECIAGNEEGEGSFTTILRVQGLL